MATRARQRVTRDKARKVVEGVGVTLALLIGGVAFGVITLPAMIRIGQVVF